MCGGLSPTLLNKINTEKKVGKTFGGLNFFSYLCSVRNDKGRGETLKYNFRAKQTESVKGC